MVVTASRPAAMPMPAPPPPPMMMAMAKPRAQQSDLGDYKLYTLDEPATVAARQTKQVAFLDPAGVAYGMKPQVYRGAASRSIKPGVTPALLCQTMTTSPCLKGNTTAKGLGRALPAGSVAFKYQPGTRTSFSARTTCATCRRASRSSWRWASRAT